MNRVIEILMKRDELSYEAAKEMVDNCRSELWDCFEGTNILTPEEVIEYELGLEPDYIFDII